MPKSIVLLAAQTGAITTGEFTLDQGSELTIVSNPLAGVETVTIQIYDNAKAAWYDLTLDGKKQTLDLNTNAIQIYGIGVYRCVKSVTAATVGVSIQR